MKLLKIFALAVLAAGALFMSSSCTPPEGGEDKVENILIINGQTYPLKFAMYFEIEDGVYNVDMDTKDFGPEEEPDNIHGYGELIYRGKDVQVDVAKEDPIYSSGFNFLRGGYYQASNFKSGTQSVKKTEKNTFILIVDCIDQGGSRFYLNAEIQDERTIDWSQFD